MFEPSTCNHEDVAHVVGIDGTHHADVCTHCLAALDPGYRCPDCDWITDEDAASYAEVAAGVLPRYRAHACTAHRA